MVGLSTSQEIEEGSGFSRSIFIIGLKHSQNILAIMYCIALYVYLHLYLHFYLHGICLGIGICIVFAFVFAFVLHCIV